MSDTLKRPTLAAFAIAALLGACGGGGSNPFDNPAAIENPPGIGGQKLSFAYFQRCVFPVFLAQLPINQGGVSSINTCAGSGCHDNANGTGGSFRVIPTATVVDVTDAANTPDVIRETDMYKNFYSAQAATVLGAPTQSRLLNKPLVNGVLHGGGIVFANSDDPNAKLFAFWISRPVPAGHDEFSDSANNLFTPPDPINGACNTQ
jgi:hypothetical protein